MENANTLNKQMTTENVSQVKNTWVFFDDDFSLIAHTGYNGFSLLPEWLERMEQYREYRTINRHGEKIKT